MPQFDVALYDKPLTLRPISLNNAHTGNNKNVSTDHSRNVKDIHESDSNDNTHDVSSTKPFLVSVLLAIAIGIVIPCVLFLFITDCRVVLGGFMVYMWVAFLCFAKIAYTSQIIKRGAKLWV